jgi:hypothetical protein
VKADLAARRIKANKLLGLDVLDLRHRIPHRWYVWSYTRLLPLAYKSGGPGGRRGSDRHHGRRLVRDRGAGRHDAGALRGGPLSPIPSPPRSPTSGLTPMLAVGLTGGIGSGKSAVADLLVARGAVLIDADQVARDVVAPGGPAYQPLIDRFGTGIVAATARSTAPPWPRWPSPTMRPGRPERHHAPGHRHRHDRGPGRLADTDHIVVLAIPLLTRCTGRR